MSVAKVKDGLGAVRRESSEMVEEGKLYAVAPMPVLLLCRGQVSLEDPTRSSTSTAIFSRFLLLNL